MEMQNKIRNIILLPSKRLKLKWQEPGVDKYMKQWELLSITGGNHTLVIYFAKQFGIFLGGVWKQTRTQKVTYCRFRFMKCPEWVIP